MEKELHKSFVNANEIPEDTENFFEKGRPFLEMMMRYQSAIKEVSTKFEILNMEMSIKNNRNPIETIKSRIKSPQSIVNKLKRKNFEVSLDSVVKNLNDVAGVRVICSFVNDIYYVAELFSKQDDVKVIEIKDYIKNPKPNGYRSYHMIIEIPVFFSNEKQFIRVEVQIRTMAMDFWASLEHQVKYKKDIKNALEIEVLLKECADVISASDLKMMNIAQKIDIL